MTPNPESPRFIIHEVPDTASETALKLRHTYRILYKDITDNIWPSIMPECLSLDYNIYNGRVRISIKFVDKNNHTHSFSLSYNGFGKTICDYVFEGIFETSEISFRSYAAWLMLQLWEFEIGVELCKCDRGLTVSIHPEQAYEVISKMLDIVTSNIKPIEWFFAKEPVWGFYRTYRDLQKMLPLLQEEASKERWKNVRPDNFRLIRNADCALICLDYTDTCKYNMRFCVGLKKNGFGTERPDKFMDMFYQFDNYASDEEFRNYLDEENKAFSEIANLVLSIPFKWKAIFFNSEDGFYINTYREYAFQKFCLMLDCIIPLKDHYKARKPFVSSEILETKRQLEIALSTEMDICENHEATLIFTHGFYIEDSVEEDEPEECPF